MSSIHSELVCTQIYRPLSVIDGFFTNNLLLNDLAFDSDLHVKRIECPILMIHAKDDVIVKVSLFEKVNVPYDLISNTKLLNFIKLSFTRRP